MTAMPESHLRAVIAPQGDPISGDGLTLAYASLERLRAEHGLDRLTVVIEDPAMGRQVLVAPRGTLPPSPLGDTGGWRAEPPLDGAHLDLDLAVTVCRQALRLAALEPSPGGSADSLELALRGLAGVDAVAIDDAVEVIRVRVDAGATADDVAPDALHLAQAHVDHSVVVEVVGSDGSGRVPSPASTAPSGTPRLELLAVRTDPGSGELEVHLQASEVRTVGRGRLAAGLTGAAVATLAAWHALPGAPHRAVRWARTVETSAAGRFVVAVALDDPDHSSVAHGIGAGPNPLDAAVAATVDSLRR